MTLEAGYIAEQKIYRLIVFLCYFNVCRFCGTSTPIQVLGYWGTGIGVLLKKSLIPDGSYPVDNAKLR